MMNGRWLKTGLSSSSPTLSSRSSYIVRAGNFAVDPFSIFLHAVWKQERGSLMWL